MSRIDDLIHELCPGGVDYRALRDVAAFRRGSPMTAKTIIPGAIPVVANAPEVSLFHAASNRDGQTVVMARSGAYAGLVTFWDRPIYLTDAFSIHGNPGIIAPRFLFHALQARQRLLHDMKKGAGVPHVRVKEIETWAIPVPPLEVQRAIVEILDTFTALAAELEAELGARRKQYAHHRDELFTLFSSTTNCVRWTTIDRICTNVSSGGTPLVSRQEYYGGGIPWLRTQEVNYSDIWQTQQHISRRGLENSSAKMIPPDCVIVAISGAGVTRGRVAVNKIPLATNQHCCNLEIDPAIAHYRFVYHWLVRQYDDLRSRGHGNRSDLNVGIIAGYQIPVPPLEEQHRIASILDQFDALVNDLSIGLPAELAARRKQYDYYRDKLLTFPEAA